MFPGLKSAAAQTLEESSGYEYFFDPTTSTSTSLSFVNKLQVTTNVIDSGFYILAFTGDVANDRANKRTGFRVNWREDGVTAFTEIHTSENGTAAADQFQTRSGFTEIEVQGGSTVTIQAQFSFTEAGSTVSCRRVGFYLFKVKDLV